MNHIMNSVIKAELSDEKPHFCAKCEQLIRDRYFLKALNVYWHEDCLKCGSCAARLADVGSTLYTRENHLLCRSDYMRLYGNTGMCAACNKMIPAFEMVMRARRNVYHLECFACQQCTHRFCVGDRFYLYENRILCESDYAEKLQLAAAANNNIPAAATAEHSNTNTIQHKLQQQQQQQQLQQLQQHGGSNTIAGHKSQSQHGPAGPGGVDRIAPNFNLKSLSEFGMFAGMGRAGSSTQSSTDHHVVVR